ncbi:hypothetical protein [Endozoicomonas ascidiicola]|uniref:hypothetical protein n=1 Tax=Endozoicomonas ascidiicola TaxID=1698521 RepID=UPI000AA93170|nr:hypothetical protein [Endozoicomonas ascidiicola]
MESHAMSSRADTVYCSVPQLDADTSETPVANPCFGSKKCNYLLHNPIKTIVGSIILLGVATGAGFGIASTAPSTALEERNITSSTPRPFVNQHSAGVTSKIDTVESMLTTEPSYNIPNNNPDWMKEVMTREESKITTDKPTTTTEKPTTTTVPPPDIKIMRCVDANSGFPYLSSEWVFCCKRENNPYWKMIDKPVRWNPLPSCNDNDERDTTCTAFSYYQNRFPRDKYPTPMQAQYTMSLHYYCQTNKKGRPEGYENVSDGYPRVHQ